MDLGLKNKVAIVSGSSKGIGRAIALALALEGVRVVICGRDVKALRLTHKEIDHAGGTSVMAQADITTSQGIKRVLACALKKFGRLDILVNNAGGALQYGDLMSLKATDWMRCYQLNVVAAAQFVKAAVPSLRQSTCGRIINIASISGVTPGFYNPHYAAAKAGMINLTKHLAKFLAKDQVLVNAICAGPAHSEAWDKNIEHVARLKKQDVRLIRRSFEKQEALKIPLGRVGEGRDIAGMVVFLASEQARWITGSVLTVDGGKSL